MIVKEEKYDMFKLLILEVSDPELVISSFTDKQIVPDFNTYDIVLNIEKQAKYEEFFSKCLTAKTIYLLINVRHKEIDLSKPCPIFNIYLFFIDLNFTSIRWRTSKIASRYYRTNY